ncbi:aryl-sulfate sulfotransferase [Robiginitalea sp. M366]|uniref:aryl-sulfate sulfotransferase n=1 Tax=Robiginitalea aestuariiviva TaxID=3036903 RepID=UPI00240D0A56|nr:aryl-sulfate sulfotransferase [Robiginitalea aestuariiviva]MDG1572090.1 aryl-sulfate sulfotransferase [Robiginitalea aestuariiviva]
MKNTIRAFVVLCFLGGWATACSDNTLEEPEVVQQDPDPSNPNDPDGENPQDFTPVGTVEMLNSARVDNNLILVNDAGANRVYLMDKEARLLYEWELTNNIGNDVVLLPDGRLLASLESDDPQIRFGGKGGRLQFVAPDGTVEWDFLYSSPDAETHHDIELLPNGNIIALVWEKRTAQQALDAGSSVDIDVYPEAVIEVDPNTNTIVWEWHAWDHLIQEHDPEKANYGSIAENPGRIDLNYVAEADTWEQPNGDIMHANAIAYDPVNDAIFISANFFSEVWVIDHSTTTAEAAGSTGGAYGKGGDLIYRFGNPEAYRNQAGTRLFHNNHYPNLLRGEDQGKLLIFSNGNDINQSTVYELELPATYALEAGADNEPQVLWSFTDPDLYSGKVSGAVPLPNGNILITEGDFGYWEVTRDKEVVWKFNATGFFWRGYHHNRDAPEIEALGIEVPNL